MAEGSERPHTFYTWLAGCSMAARPPSRSSNVVASVEVCRTGFGDGGSRPAAVAGRRRGGGGPLGEGLEAPAADAATAPATAAVRGGIHSISGNATPRAATASTAGGGNPYTNSPREFEEMRARREAALQAAVAAHRKPSPRAWEEEPVAPLGGGPAAAAAAGRT